MNLTEIQQKSHGLALSCINYCGDLDGNAASILLKTLMERCIGLRTVIQTLLHGEIQLDGFSKQLAVALDLVAEVRLLACLAGDSGHAPRQAENLTLQCQELSEMFRYWNNLLKDGKACNAQITEALWKI